MLVRALIAALLAAALGACAERTCRSDADCLDGQFCIWWTAGCGPGSEEGTCGPHTDLDACGGCNLQCGCDGVTQSGWSTGPWAHRGPCGSGASGVDGG